MLIDADLREPSLHEMFGMPHSPGLVKTPSAQLDYQVMHTFRSLGACK
jgi:Mrp family chromosome partitioning ATPase